MKPKVIKYNSLLLLRDCEYLYKGKDDIYIEAKVENGYLSGCRWTNTSESSSGKGYVLVDMRQDCANRAAKQGN